MSEAADHRRLIETLRDAQRLGFFGGRPIEQAVEHSTAFVSAIEALRSDSRGRRLVDLGSGGGLPGLVLADAFRDSELVLIDRRQKRTDFLERAVSRLGWTHVLVRCGDVSELAAEVADGRCEPFDVVTARGFGPPEVTLRAAADLRASDGVVLISEPPAGDRWPADLLEELSLTGERMGAIRMFSSR
jgi:16S rRNA (guanine527-N7)-methyltransferase